MKPIDVPRTPSALAGYGLPDGTDNFVGPRKGCIIDMDDPELRAAAVATGLTWSAPMGAQVAAVLDIATGPVPYPGYALPEWAVNTLDYYRDHPEAVADD